MSDAQLEAPNPFNQNQLQEGDSVNFNSSFWKEEEQQSATTSQSQPYEQATSSYSTGNAYDDDEEEYPSVASKPNAISTLFNSMKSKLTADDGAASSAPYTAYKDNDNGNAFNNANDDDKKLSEREAYLDARETKLLEKKKRLEAVKQELSSSNVRRDNWPCHYYPITFHSIQQEIPPFARSHMNRMYWLVRLAFVCMASNTFAELVLYFDNVTSDSNLLLAVLYLFCGSCGAWRLWYRQIYYAIRDRKTMKWWCFFFFFAAHIGFTACMALGIENWGGAGVIIMIDCFQSNKSFSGFVCLICTCIWTLSFLSSLFYLKRSWVLFKQRGGVDASRDQLTNALTRHAVDQLV